MPIEIEKGVPIPDSAQRSRYPFAQMEVGDSFFAPGRTTKQMQNAASTHRKKGKKFRAMKEFVDGVEGTRIWRVE